MTGPQATAEGEVGSVVCGHLEHDHLQILQFQVEICSNPPQKLVPTVARGKLRIRTLSMPMSSPFGLRAMLISSKAVSQPELERRWASADPD